LDFRLDYAIGSVRMANYKGWSALWTHIGNDFGAQSASNKGVQSRNGKSRISWAFISGDCMHLESGQILYHATSIAFRNLNKLSMRPGIRRRLRRFAYSVPCEENQAGNTDP